MRRTTLALASVGALVISACGGGPGSEELPEDPNAPVIQITSEGGFAPVEFILANGPRYTLTADGSLIHTGPVAAIYPGPLLPNNLVTVIDDSQIDQVLDLVDEIGLPEMEEELDDTFASVVADATTEVITYWDADGVQHRYGVYALGLEPSDNPSTAAFEELLILLDGFVATGEAVPFEGERVRVVAGEAVANPDFEDERPWPLEDTDFSDWAAYPNGWVCKVYGPEIIDDFADATQATTWTNPSGSGSLTLLVRYLHPGETDCHEQG